MAVSIPRVLVVDDILGRRVVGGNDERASFCLQLLIRDITGDQPQSEIDAPVAEAVFIRGQTPVLASVGDVVENDLHGTLRAVRAGSVASKGQLTHWSLVLLDLCFYTGRVTTDSDARMPGLPKGNDADSAESGYFGLRVLEALQRECPEVPVVVLSAQNRETASRRFSAGGARAFLPRTSDTDSGAFKKVLMQHGLIPDETGLIVGSSPKLLMALRDARRAAAVFGTRMRHVLIRGEHGTGKELVAKMLNRLSRTAVGVPPLVTVNTSSLVPTLWASELFGHGRGAFTGATENRRGMLVDGDGGDVFLDEIGSIPPQVQAGLLRFLEDGKVTPVGGNTPRQVDVRVLTATNEPIEERAAQGAFRADLLQRLRAAGTIYLPPLRERFGDVPVLLEHFVREAEQCIPGARPREVRSSAVDVVCSAEWPGNIRQLMHCVSQAVWAYPDLEFLEGLHLREVIRGFRVTVAQVPAERHAPSEDAEQDRPGMRNSPGESTRETAGSGPPLRALIAQIQSCSLRGAKWHDLQGRLPELEVAVSGLMARYVCEAFRQNRKPNGDFNLTGAMKFATGEAKLSTTDAKRRLKQLVMNAQTDDDDLAEIRQLLEPGPAGVSGTPESDED